MGGFTLIELMVSLAIMLTATGLLLQNYPESTIRLRLLNYIHASSLLFREAQIRGSAVDSTGGTIGGYGVFISLASSSQIALFSDNTSGVDIKNVAGLSIGDGLYNESISPDKIADTLKFQDDFVVKKICIASSTAVTSYGYLCNNSNSPPISNLTVSFSRPDQTAHIYINGTSSEEYPAACVQLYSRYSPKSGHVRSVVVYHSGIISTSMISCD